MDSTGAWRLVPKPQYLAIDNPAPAVDARRLCSGKSGWETAADLAAMANRGAEGIARCSTKEWARAHGALPYGFETAQGYALAITPRAVTIGADTSAGLRNALQTLAQLVLQSRGRLPAMRVVDWPLFPVRCAHICYHLAMDWMPESVPNFTALLELIKRLAHFKYNAVLLEIESMFPYRRYPDISARDAFSPAQIEKLKEVCAQWGLEIIPLLQCLGHAYNVLRLPRFAHLRETIDTNQQYCPSNPGARKLYLELLDEVAAGLGPVKRFHIGGDESRRLGVCPACAKTAARDGVGALYGRHTGQVARAVLDRGLTPLIWSDMIEHHPTALKYLPEKTELVYWKYTLPRDDRGIDFYQFGQYRLWAASGVRFGGCNHTMYRFQHAMQGIAFLAGEARRTGCGQWIVTDWMKGIPFELSCIGQAYGAEAAWSGARGLDEFSAAYTRVVFGAEEPRWWQVYADLDHTLPYCEDAQYHQYDGLDRYDLSGRTFRERMAAKTETRSRPQVRAQLQSGAAKADGALEIIAALERRTGQNIRELHTVRISAETNAHKARLGLAIDKAVRLLKFPAPGDAARRRALAAEFARLAAEHKQLRAATATLLSKTMVERHWRALLDFKFEPAALAWMEYFRKALKGSKPLPGLLGPETVPPPGARRGPPIA